MITYFAYGSNMHHAQLRERSPSSRFLGPARLDGYQLVFTRYSSKRAGGVADILTTRGASVWGGLFELTPDDIRALDCSEGTYLNPPAYRRVIVEVKSQDHSDGVLTAFTYEVVEKGAFRPSVAYLHTIIEGARHCSLPPDYIQTLRTIEVS